MPNNTKRNAQSKEDSGDISDDLQVEVDEGMNDAIIKMLLEQPPAGKKSLGNSRAFQTQREALYNEARKNSKNSVRDGIAFLEDAQGKLDDLQAQEISFEKYYQDCHLPLTAQQKSVDRAQTLYPPLLETLGLRRSNQVDGACNMLKKKGPQRQEALKEFSKYAKAQVNQARQTEKDAADATALIKGYKALKRPQRMNLSRT